MSRGALVGWLEWAGLKAKSFNHGCTQMDTDKGSDANCAN
jgi:hypothetical protein